MSAGRRRLPPGERRSQLLDAAMDVFREKGVAGTTVSDVVRAAGVAQGTFYLYFASKEEAIDAVVERMVERMVARVREAVALAGVRPIDKLLALRDALLEIGDEPHERELMALYHRPENRAVHDLMGERAARELAPLIATVVREGVSRGEFVAEHPDVTAAFILGAFSGLEQAAPEGADANALVEALTAFVLRGLGWPDVPLPRDRESSLEE